MGIFGGGSDRQEYLDLDARLRRLEEQVARLTHQLAQGAGTVPPGTPPPPLDDVYAEARALARKGRKIEAIKRVRAQTGLGLRESADIVDSW